jgi:hypothetical protein
VRDYYQEYLDEEGYISFCNREDDGVADGDEENQGGGGAAILAVSGIPAAPLPNAGGQRS